MQLEGVRVVDLTRILSGPFCTQLLADLGADVIKIEPPEGDPVRAQGALVDGLSWYFAAFNRNKRSVVLDLRSDAGKAALEMWVRVARRELAMRGKDNIWVTAVRPGFVDTPLTREVAAMAHSDYPLASQMRRQMASGEGVMDIDTAARQIWATLPTDQSLLLFGEQVRREGEEAPPPADRAGWPMARPPR